MRIVDSHTTSMALVAWTWGGESEDSSDLGEDILFLSREYSTYEALSSDEIRMIKLKGGECCSEVNNTADVKYEMQLVT